MAGARSHHRRRYTGEDPLAATADAARLPTLGSDPRASPSPDHGSPPCPQGGDAERLRRRAVAPRIRPARLGLSCHRRAGGLARGLLLSVIAATDMRQGCARTRHDGRAVRADGDPSAHCAAQGTSPCCSGHRPTGTAPRRWTPTSSSARWRRARVGSARRGRRAPTRRLGKRRAMADCLKHAGEAGA
jgi:hypothetical protein